MHICSEYNNTVLYSVGPLLSPCVLKPHNVMMKNSELQRNIRLAEPSILRLLAHEIAVTIIATFPNGLARMALFDDPIHDHT